MDCLLKLNQFPLNFYHIDISKFTKNLCENEEKSWSFWSPKIQISSRYTDPSLYTNKYTLYYIAVA